MKRKKSGHWRKTIGAEWFFSVSLATTIIFFLFSAKLFAALTNPVGLAVIFIWLFAVVLGSALCVVRHADHVAEILGEPYGTLV